MPRASGTRLLCLLAGVTWLAQSASAWTQSEAAAPQIIWHCWYDADGSYRIKCFTPEPAGAADALFEDLRRAGDLIGATRRVRQAPQAFAGTMMYIPIYTHPTRGMAFVARLARAAMCGSNPACQVAFDPEVPA